MALAYTAPIWSNGSGTGISASQLQALSDCVEGLVQGSDKAITNISISGQTITLTFADGSIETGTASGLKGISNIAKTGTSGLVDTYTITYTDGSTSTFTITNGAQGQQGVPGPQGQKGDTGDDGFSPEVTITTITGGHRVNITDAEHPSGQNFDVMDGESGVSSWADISDKPFDLIGEGLYISTNPQSGEKSINTRPGDLVDVKYNTNQSATNTQVKYQIIENTPYGMGAQNHKIEGTDYMRTTLQLSSSQDTQVVFGGNHTYIDFDGYEHIVYNIESSDEIEIFTGSYTDNNDYPYKSAVYDDTAHTLTITFPPYTGSGNVPEIHVVLHMIRRRYEEP